ncbi:MAG: site-specific DNA-methyltransferase [Acidimicrobiales bacterium]
MNERSDRTQTSSFGVGRREGHDASTFYARFAPPELSDDETVNRPDALIDKLGSGAALVGSSADMSELPDNSVALVITSPPYFVGKEYELAVTGDADGVSQIPGSYLEFLDMLRDVFAECRRVLEPGGRIAVNVANLGRKPYRSLSADVISILQDDLGLLLRGEVIWEKASTSSGSCAWGSFAKASNPVLRDMTERVIIASKGRFSRALTTKQRERQGLPYESTITNDEFLDVTRDVWRIDAESATRIGHPAPFPIELPRRLIDLYSYTGDIVLDPFLGSGTTLVAAARAGRIGVGYDTDPAFASLAEQRLDAELERIDRLDAAVGSLDQRPIEQQREIVGSLSIDDRQEFFQALAVSEGKKVQDLAERRLHEAGFGDIRAKAKHSPGILEFDFQIVSPASGTRWWVDASGAFTSSRPGLQRIDAVWKLLGRLNVLQAMSGASTERAIVLTSSLPRVGSPAHKALRAVGPEVIFDLIEIYDPAGLERLRRYATDPDPVPLVGFWSEEDLSRNS